MARRGVRIFTVDEGDGEPVVLVHGSWDDHTAWHGVAPALEGRFRVIRYDRRGYGRSERPPGRRRRRQHEDDLACVIERLGGPAHVVGSSYGASTALGLAFRRPELLRSLCLHEAPLAGAASDDARLRPLLDEVRARIDAVVAQLRAGDHAGGARRFVEEVALGPRAWDQLPAAVHERLVRHAPAFLGDLEDPDWSDLDLAAGARIGCPVLVTSGRESPRWLREVAAFVAGRIDGAQALELAGVGHLPHQTDPLGYAGVVEAFLTSVPAATAATRRPRCSAPRRATRPRRAVMDRRSLRRRLSARRTRPPPAGAAAGGRR
jgi:pimeloyl-ACP methyl ester carboxylesterase